VSFEVGSSLRLACTKGSNEVMLSNTTLFITNGSAQLQLQVYRKQTRRITTTNSVTLLQWHVLNEKDVTTTYPQMRALHQHIHWDIIYKQQCS
jgi:hypothetical protein